MSEELPIKYVKDKDGRFIPITSPNAVINSDGKNINEIFVSYRKGVTAEVEINELLEKVYPIGSIYMSIENNSPASWLGGTWKLIKDRFLIGAGGSYSKGATGGSTTHSHGLNSGFAKINYGWIDNANKLVLQPKQATWSGGLKTRDGMNGYDFPSFTESTATELGGSTDSASNIPPYLAVYMWERTA